MDMGGSDNPAVIISDYKQVGAWFLQTDGPQMYPGSRVQYVFYHANDDVIKATAQKDAAGIKAKAEEDATSIKAKAILDAAEAKAKDRLLK